MLYIFFLFFFSLRWVSCTPNSTVGHLSIFTSRLTFSFFEVPSTCSFLFPRIYIFLEQSPSFENIASGSRNDLSINFTGNNRNGIMFLAILSRVRSRIILGESGDGNEWIYVDAYFRSRSSMYE
jgi:hypothetical protein